MTPFESVLAALARDGVRLVAGALAAMQAGFVRVTGAVAVVLGATVRTVRHFLASIEAFSPAATPLTLADFPIAGALRIAEAFHLDVFIPTTGLMYADLLPQGGTHDVFGQSIRFLGIHGQFRLEDATARPQAQVGVDALCRIRRGESLS